MVASCEKNINSKKQAEKSKPFKYFVVISLLFFVLLAVLFVKNHSAIYRTNTQLTENIYKSMMDKNNRIKVYNKAVELNNGTSANTCVYFLSEVLRMNGLNIDEHTCSTDQLITILKNMGWKTETDYKKLKSGDICFTTDEKLNVRGVPTHTYIFMSWVKDGSYDYAYICDNQAKDYENKILHVRNIAKVDTVKGIQKEPFSFFIYK